MSISEIEQPTGMPGSEGTAVPAASDPLAGAVEAPAGDFAAPQPRPEDEEFEPNIVRARE
jgi:hypothetical protein